MLRDLFNFARHLYSEELNMGGYPVISYYHSENDNTDSIMEVARKYDPLNAWDNVESFLKLRHLIELALFTNYLGIEELCLHHEELSAEELRLCNEARLYILSFIDAMEKEEERQIAALQ